MAKRSARLGRLSGLVLALGLGLIASCDEGEPSTSSPVDAAAEAQRRLQVTGFVRALERERYFVSFDPKEQSGGASDPLVTIVAFVDYGGPELAADEQLEGLLAAHAQDLRLVTFIAVPTSSRPGAWTSSGDRRCSSTAWRWLDPTSPTRWPRSSRPSLRPPSGWSNSVPGVTRCMRC